MKKHTKIFLESRGLSQYDTLLCEVCQAPMTDCHHITNRGAGGSKLLDTPENLIGLCRPCHNLAHRDREFNEGLREISKQYKPI